MTHCSRKVSVEKRRTFRPERFTQTTSAETNKLSDSAGLCRTLLYSVGLSQTLPDSAGLSQTLPDSLRPCQTLLDSAGPCCTLSDSLRPCRTPPDSLRLCRTLSDSTGLSQTLPDSAGPCRTRWASLQGEAGPDICGGLLKNTRHKKQTSSHGQQIKDGGPWWRPLVAAPGGGPWWPPWWRPPGVSLSRFDTERLINVSAASAFPASDPDRGSDQIWTDFELSCQSSVTFLWTHSSSWSRPGPGFPGLMDPGSGLQFTGLTSELLD
ncbi:uncharacterized protein V6R79_017692 [Siganus canaliculatus]